MILRLLFLALCIVVVCLPWLGGVSTPATLIAIGLPHDPPLDSVAIPPLAPLLAEWLLGPSEEGRDAAPAAHSCDADDSGGGGGGRDDKAAGLSSLDASATPHLALCHAPACGGVDMLTVTLLRRRVAAAARAEKGGGRGSLGARRGRAEGFCGRGRAGAGLPTPIIF